MLKNVITGPKVTEIYRVSADVNRGAVVVKNLATGKADPADGVGVEIYFVDKDNQPMGALSDVEISQYDLSLDVVKADELAILVKPALGVQYATDQIDNTGLVSGDYLVAGTATNVGKLVKATTGNVSTLKYIGTFDDAGHTLYRFEVVEPHTVA